MGIKKWTCTLLFQNVYTYNLIFSQAPTPLRKILYKQRKRIELRNVVLQFQWFSWREAICVFSWGMCRPSWNSVNGAPLKGCIVWTLTKPNWFGQILTEGHVEGYLSVYRFICDCSGMWATVCVHACMCTCLIWFTYKYPLCVPTKRYNQVLLLTSPWWRQLVYGRCGSVSSMFAWCFDAIMYLCVILAPCHS